MTTQTVGLNIRSFNANDYEAYATLFNKTYTDFLRTADEWRFEDELREARLRHARWIAERDGRVVGVGEYDQFTYNFNPHKFWVDVLVDPDVQVQGIGAALYTTVIEALRAFEPRVGNSYAREDMPCRRRFLENRGFVENFRAWASELDLSAFDPAPFWHYVDEVLGQGVEITTLAALGDGPEVRSQLYDMHRDINRDMPLPPGDERQEVPLEEWVKGWDRPGRLPEGIFLAAADGMLVGTSQLWLSPETDMLRTGLTGTRRDYRRRGIAFALKLKALQFAQQYGARRVVTDNASINRPMLAINEAIGFVKGPAWIHYAKAF